MKQQSQVYLDTNRPLQSIFLPLIKSALASQPSKLTIFSSLLTSGQHAHCLPSPVILPLTNTEFQLLQKIGGRKHGWFKPFVLLSPLHILLHYPNRARNPQKKKKMHIPKAGGSVPVPPEASPQSSAQPGLPLTPSQYIHSSGRVGRKASKRGSSKEQAMGKQQQSKPSPCEPHCSSLQALRRMALAGYGFADFEMA